MILTIKYLDIIIVTDYIDFGYTTNISNSNENNELFVETYNKIMNCMYYKFTKHQKQIYKYLLDMIKEINFDAFIDLKRKLFYSSELVQDIVNNQESEKSTFRVIFLVSLEECKS